jgi:hypothetical protein
MPGPGNSTRISIDSLAAELLDALGEQAQANGGPRARMARQDILNAQHVPDQVRWGDSKLVGPFAASVLAAAVTTDTTQIVRVEHDRATSWTIFLVADFLNWTAADTATITVIFKTIIGVGSASVTLVDTVAVAPPYDQVQIQKQVPSKHIQVSATVILPPATYVGGELVNFTAMAAPVVS